MGVRSPGRGDVAAAARGTDELHSQSRRRGRAAGESGQAFEHVRLPGFVGSLVF